MGHVIRTASCIEFTFQSGSELIQATGTNPVTTFHKESSGVWYLKEVGIIRSKDGHAITPMTCSDLPVRKAEIFTLDGWKKIPQPPFVIKAPASYALTVSYWIEFR